VILTGLRFAVVRIAARHGSRTMSSEFSRQDLEVEDHGDVAVVRFKERRLEDEEHLRALFQHLTGLVDAGRPNLVLNFNRVEFLASVAIGKLVMLNRKVQAAGGRLALCHLSPATDETLEIMHLKDIVRTHDSEQEALRSF
jgi:anti-anti-sigma factor